MGRLKAGGELNRNYGFGVNLGDCADEPKLRDLTGRPLCPSLRRRAMEMVWPEVMVKGAITQRVVGGGQDGSGGGAGVETGSAGSPPGPASAPGRCAAARASASQLSSAITKDRAVPRPTGRPSRTSGHCWAVLLPLPSSHTGSGHPASRGRSARSGRSCQYALPPAKAFLPPVLFNGRPRNHRSHPFQGPSDPGCPENAIDPSRGAACQAGAGWLGATCGSLNRRLATSSISQCGWG
jgi:hypothetical protein